MKELYLKVGSLFKKEDLPLWTIGLGHMFTHWYPATFYMILPFLGRELGLSYTQIGFIITFRSLAGAVFSIPGGILVDLVGRRSSLMVLALLWVGLPYALMGIGGGYIAVLLFSALIGVGNNFWHPAAIAELGERYENRRGWALGIHNMGANIGDTLGPIVAGLLLGILLWRQVLIVNALPGLAAAALIWFLLSRVNKDDVLIGKKKTSKGMNLFEYKKEIKGAFNNKSVFFLLLLSGVRAFSQNSLMTFLPLYFINVLSISTIVAGIYMGAVQIGGSIAAPLSGYFSDRKGRRAIISGGLLSTSLILIILATVRMEMLFIIFLSFLGFALYSLRPVIQAWLIDVTPAGSRGTSVGVQFSVQRLFTSVAPLVGGWIADSWGLINTFYFVALIMIVTNVGVYFIKEDKKTETGINVDN